MFTLLILASYVAGEWVEISQNHYRQEPPRRVTINYEDTAVANRIYTNYTLTERPWNQGVVARIPNRGNIKRVQFPSKAKEKFSYERLPERISSERTTNTNREYENFGPVRTPNVKSDDYFENNNIKGKFEEGDNLKHESAKINENPNVKFQTFNVPTSNIEGQLKADDQKTQEFKILDDNYQGKFVQNNKFKFEDNPSLKPDQSSDDSKNKRVQLIKYSDENFNKHFDMNNKKTEETLDEETKNRTSSRIESSLPKDELTSQNTVKNVKNKHSSGSKSNSDINIIEVNKSYFHEEADKEIKIENSAEIVKELNSQRNNNDDGKRPNDTRRDAFHRTDDNIGKSSKSNTVEVIWKLMKVVTDNISRNTRRSFRSKVRYLEDLRNTILSNIEERVEEAWPDAAGGRQRRSAARGHVEFPSSESALMTISFLTFAVFLIKLVLQVIHTYKNKTMMVTPAVVAAVGRAAASLTHRSPDNS